MSKPRSTVAPVPDRIVMATAFLPLPPDDAFMYFTDDAPLQSWLSAATDVEARVGGKYELFWEPADRENNSTIGCRVTAIASGPQDPVGHCRVRRRRRQRWGARAIPERRSSASSD